MATGGDHDIGVAEFDDAWIVNIEVWVARAIERESGIFGDIDPVG